MQNQKTRSVIQAGFFGFALKNLVLLAKSGFSGPALEYGVLNHKFQANSK
jgi:hypothetical protein